MKRFILILALVGGVVLSARAQYGLLTFAPEARSMALGGASVTTISSSNTVFNNPSLVSFVDAPFQVAASYSGSSSREYYSLSTYYQFLSGGSIQAGWRSFHYDDNDEMSFELGYARPIARIFSIAITGRYIHGKDALGEKSDALAADLSASCRIPLGGSNLLVGARLNNLGAYLSGTTDGMLPVQFTAGVGFDLTINESHRLFFTGDTGYCFNPDRYKGAEAAVGVEYEFMQLLQFRGGYHYGESGSVYPNYASVGAGIRFLFFRVDFSYLIATSSNTRDIYSLNVGLKF